MKDMKDYHEQERVIEDGLFLGWIRNFGQRGWFVQLPGVTAWTCPRWGCTREEAIAYLREKSS